MTVKKIGGADTHSYADYLTSSDARERGDYYLGRDGDKTAREGRWHGQGAAELGLNEGVDRDALLEAWDGNNPATGKRVIRRSMGGEHVAGVDVTFSAPKSVSVVWALADPYHRAEIEAAHEAAAEVALDHIEKHAPLMRRRVDGMVTHEKAAGLVVSRFRHHTSRLCKDRVASGTADPQLHDHCTIANMALRREGASASNGRWGAIDSRELYRTAGETGAVYRAELAHRLKAMGYRVHREGRYFEITGVPEEVRRAFSSRAVEVEAAIAKFVAERGRQPTDIEERAIVVRSRGVKSVDDASAFQRWEEKAEGLGFSVEAAAALRGNPGSDARFHQAARSVVREQTDLSSQKSLTRETAAVDQRMVRIAVAEAAQGRASGRDVGRLIDTVMASPEVVALADDKVTTRAMLAIEESVLARATQLARRTGDVGASDAATRRAVAEARVPLTPEQVDAVERLRVGGGLMLLTAPAGSGKGEVLRAVAQAHQAEGRRVVALAAAGETAQRLGAELGADATHTIDSYVRRAAETGDVPGADTVLVVDEAALLETTRWSGLLEQTGAASVIAAGDDGQLSPIEAGGVWAVMARRIGTVELRANHRAQDEWARDAWTALRGGAAPSAVRDFESRGLIDVQSTRITARIAAVERWDADRVAGAADGRGIDRFLLLTDSSNHEVDALNRLAQARRMVCGELGADTVRVSARDAKTGHEREEDLRVGDRVVFEQRFKPAAGRRIENGAVGTVVALDGEASAVGVQVGDRRVVVGQKDLAALRLGYAQHVYSAQGRTVDRSYIVLGGWQTDKERSYVGVSRAREQSVIVTDYDSLGVQEGRREEALGVLGERCAVSKKKVAALSLVERATTQPQIADDERGFHPARGNARDIEQQREVRDRAM